jgi:HAD superfamily hydrolase (TIGR01509 family)
MEKIKALLCDIDGTLVHSNWLHAAAWKDTFEVIDIHLDLEDISRQIGKGGDELIPVFVPWWRRPAVQKPLEAYRSFIFRTQYFPQVEPFPRVREFIVTVQRHSIDVALASSANQQDLNDYINITRIGDIIEATTSADDAKRTKPNPDIFTAALHKLGVSSKNAIALGDTPYDAEAAGKAGVSTIGVTTGGWSEPELLEAGCIEVYKDVADLLDRFDTSILARSASR